jgi:hypothetical protein
MIQGPIKKRLLRKRLKSKQGRLRERRHQQQFVAGQEEIHR